MSNTDNTFTNGTTHRQYPSEFARFRSAKDLPIEDAAVVLQIDLQQAKACDQGEDIPPAVASKMDELEHLSQGNLNKVVARAWAAIQPCNRPV